MWLELVITPAPGFCEPVQCAQELDLMAVVAPEARLHWIVVTCQRCQVAGLARASCGPATCNAETVGVARWMHGAPPMWKRCVV